MLAWLSAWSEVQTCIWPSWCHCHSLSLAPVKSRLVLHFWYRLTRVVPEKGPLNVSVSFFRNANVQRSVPEFSRLSRIRRFDLVRYKPPRRFAPCRPDTDNLLGRSRLRASETQQRHRCRRHAHLLSVWSCSGAAVNQWRADLQHTLATQRLRYRSYALSVMNKYRIR